jgi:PAS domain S-box-containing protein
LDHLVDQIVHVLPIGAAGVTLISPTTEPQYVAASDESALRFEKLQTELSEGPCMAAYETGEAILVPDLHEEVRFPTFVRRALSEGLVAVFTFPLRHGESQLGALDLYRDTAGALSPAAITAAQTLADVAAAYVIIARGRAELRESSAAAEHDLVTASRLATIVEWSSDAMIGKTLDGVVTDWSSGAERMYGYTREEAIGQNVSMLVPADWPDELPMMLERVGRGEGVAHYETQRLRKDGEVFDVSVSISPIQDEHGDIVGAATVTRDITERKQAEAEFRALQERLHQSDRLESLGQLAGGIAHDFNNLLAGIMNYAALASDGLADLAARCGLGADEGAVTVAQDVAEITNVANQAAQLTRQLLIFSRRDVVQPEVLDLNAIVVDMEKLLRRTIGEGVDLRTDLAPDLPNTKVDRGQIEQVLMNLAVNGRDAMDGVGRLRIETATFEADDDYALQRGISPGPYVRLTVSDTGSGMPPEVAARAFEPFFTTKAKGEGSGLGLATVYGIATQVGGDIVIYTEPGLGTTIRVNFPATRENVTVAEGSAPEGAVTSAGETILLVEDEDMVRDPTGRILAHAGYTVLAASNADDGLRLAGEHAGEIGLLLTDVIMPGRSGKELAAEVCEMRPETKVLYMSGYSQDLIVHCGVLAEGARLIEKPFAAGDLLRRVREALDSG